LRRCHARKTTVCARRSRRPKYACRACQGAVVQAPALNQHVENLALVIDGAP
jgi:hypothetical protein